MLYLNMEYFRTAALINSLILLFIGIYAYLKNRQSSLNQMWCLFNALTAAWFSFIYTANVVTDKTAALFVVRLAHSSSILTCIIFYHFCLYYVAVAEKRKAVLRGVYAAGLTAFLIETFLPFLVVVDVVPRFYLPFTPQGSRFYFLHLLLIVGILLLSFYELARAYRNASGYKRNQMKYFFLATLIAALTMMTVLPMAFGAPVYPFGFYLFPFYGVILTYSIVKYRLMDIVVFMNRTIFFMAVVMPAVVIHVVLVWLLQTRYPYFIANGLSLIAVAALFVLTPGYRKSLQRALDSILYKGKYDYQNILRESTKAVVTMLDLNQLLDYIVDTIVKNIKVAKVSILLEDEESKEYTIAAAFGISEDMIKSFKLKPTNGIIGYLKGEPTTMVKEEMMRKLPLGQFKKIKDDIEQINAEVVMPLMYKNRIVGILNLDNKLSGDFYDPTDIDILNTLAYEAAVAIENARLYREAITDGLTKLYHHKYFKARLTEEIERTKRYARPLSLLMIDLDHFKEINDKYGHQAGDLMLQEIAFILKGNLRKVDILGRYGGEEFALLLPDTANKGAKTAADRLRVHIENTKLTAEKIRKNIAEHPVHYNYSDLKITVSIGVTSYDGEDKVKTTETIITEADSALYAAKKSGRNKVVEFSEGMSDEMFRLGQK